MRIRKLTHILGACIVVLLFCSAAFGNAIYCFNIFNNDVYANDPRLNFTVTVTDEGFYYDRWLVGFEFKNNSDLLLAAGSSITDIYFDDMPDGNLLYRKKSIEESAGVSFSVGASPKSLPGGNDLTPIFDKKPEFSADSDKPIPHNGINPGEWLKVIFKLESDKTYDDVFAALTAGGSITEANLRVGIHIQSLPEPLIGSLCANDSAAAINCTEIIPEPATIAMLSLGALSLVKRKRR